MQLPGLFGLGDCPSEHSGGDAGGEGGSDGGVRYARHAPAFAPFNATFAGLGVSQPQREQHAAMRAAYVRLSQ